MRIIAITVAQKHRSPRGKINPCPHLCSKRLWSMLYTSVNRNVALPSGMWRESIVAQGGLS